MSARKDAEGTFWRSPSSSSCMCLGSSSVCGLPERMAPGTPMSSGSPSSHIFRDLVSRSEEHTSELQSRLHLVCRLLLEKKKKKKIRFHCVSHNVILGTQRH